MTDDFDRDFWDDHYRSRGGPHERRPNPRLVAVAAELAPTSALDAGCGEGADAIWLASRGWQVTAVDVAGSALERGREHASDVSAAAAGRIRWVRADLADWSPTTQFDLVSSHYVHAPGSTEELVRRLGAAVAPGGTLLVVGHDASDHRPDSARHCHDSSDHGTSGGHAPLPGSHVTPSEMAGGLDPSEWEVIVAETTVRADTDGHGGEVVFRDAVLLARRRD